MSLARHFQAMAYQNAWANHRLLRTCGQLTTAELAAPRTSFFPSIIATLNHILIVDWYYIDPIERAVAGQPPSPEPRKVLDLEIPFWEHAPLAAAQRAADRRLVELCVGLADSSLAIAVPIQRQSGVETELVGRLLPHLFEHQIHHRGQVHAMLSGTRVPPPQLDEFFCANEAHLRAADLAELGYSEAEIWQ